MKIFLGMNVWFGIVEEKGESIIVHMKCGKVISHDENTVAIVYADKLFNFMPIDKIFSSKEELKQAILRK